MRAGAGLHRRHPCRVDQARAPQPLGIFLGDEIIGDDREIDATRTKHRNEPLDQRGLARSDRPADADACGSRPADAPRSRI